MTTELKCDPIPYLFGSIIAGGDDPIIMNTVFSILKANELPKQYKELYLIIKQCWDKFGLVEPIALFTLIENKHEKSKQASELALLLHRCWDYVNSSLFWQHYLSLTLSRLRVAHLQRLGNKLTTQAESDTVLDEVKKDIDRIKLDYTLSKERRLETVLDDYLHNVDTQQIDGGASRLKTGLYLDSHLNGFRPGDFIILAGRPKMGKSAIANQIIVKLLKESRRVLYVNMEMDEQQVLNRMVANISRMDINYLNSPETMGEDQTRLMMETVDHIRFMPLHLSCMEMRTPADVYLAGKRLVDAGTPPDLIVVDHLGLFKPEAKFNSRYEEVTELSRQFKLTAAHLNCPVLGLSQLNRAVDNRDDKRPKLSDLRDSGALEQDATAVMFAYRDDYYNPESEDVGLLEINVAANRNGTTGTDKYNIDFIYMALSNYTNTPIPPAGSGF